jgi:beta-glucosidase/6-phospho-beta-glucosidase/beta-galactosidase
MEPDGLYPLLLRTWVRYKKPIIITENGVADANDEFRQWWLEQTMLAMQRALSEGVNVRGYLHWSLLDNFEWKYGWWPKFGLVAVDREHGMKRTVRPSAIWLARYLLNMHKRDVEKEASAVSSHPTVKKSVPPKSTVHDRLSPRRRVSRQPRNVQ